MARPKKEGQFLNCKLAQPVYEGMIKFCSETGLDKTKVVERALQFYIEQHCGVLVDTNGVVISNPTLEEYLRLPGKDVK